MRILLKCGAALYRAITRVRNTLYDRGVFAVTKCGVPVISVGNISAGGNAKTPLCEFLYEYFDSRGKKPVILSRGYGGKIRGPILVSNKSAPSDVGDEPLLLAQHGKRTVIARDRVAGARYITQEKVGDLIILDDGFQHRRLHRDFDLVTINVGNSEAVSSLIHGELLPLGRLREERAKALSRASAVVFSRRGGAPVSSEIRTVLRRVIPPGIPTFVSATTIRSVSPLQGDSSRLLPTKVFAFCGLGNPEPFFYSLEKEGFVLNGRASFPDHYTYTKSDINRLTTMAQGLPLLCTEKDGVKLRSFGLGTYTMSQIHVVSISTLIEEEGEFLRLFERFN